MRNLAVSSVFIGDLSYGSLFICGTSAELRSNYTGIKVSGPDGIQQQQADDVDESGPNSRTTSAEPFATAVTSRADHAALAEEVELSIASAESWIRLEAIRILSVSDAAVFQLGDGSRIKLSSVTSTSGYRQTAD
ncbi:hypothetical protein [Paenibacillus donghaensis]|uniref:Uncharacterized protein n=1 Tax=Paenibacillus donghaensis TaxID=414771 RepID=A0A2Z2KDB2_9BACL|nr:hypothetical protein [Paenibacillus donghaensis]ASA21775.1 hypothetical protein B9T62_13945 [Paenibacillus donghaensis]